MFDIGYGQKLRQLASWPAGWCTLWAIHQKNIPKTVILLIFSRDVGTKGEVGANIVFLAKGTLHSSEKG